MRANHSVADWREAARRRLPGFIFDYVDGGAGAEVAQSRNQTAFDRWAILPRALTDVSHRSAATRLFGRDLSMPLIVAPTGMNGVVRPGGDEKIAAAAAAIGTCFTLSTAANATIESIVEASGEPPWFQLYVVDREAASGLVARAEGARCPVLMLTVDAPVGGRRLRDLRNGLTFPVTPTRRIMADVAARPSWALNHLLAGRRATALPYAGGSVNQDRLAARRFEDSLVWEDVARLRDRWPATFVIKGIMHPGDAEAAIRLGADAIVVSNHGGRQLGSAPATLAVLPDVARAVGGRARILLDGGVRGGDDILKALALGADAVMVGRPAVYALAVGGAIGVQTVLELLKTELLTSMALAGLASPSEIGPGCLWPA